MCCFRRWTAPKSTHFYVFCLVSFVLYGFKFTGELDAARPDCPVVQLSWRPRCNRRCSCTLRFELYQRRRTGRGACAGACYIRCCIIPGAVLLGLRYLSLYQLVGNGAVTASAGPGRLRLPRDIFYIHRGRELTGGGTGTKTKPLERQQLKWLTRGTLLTVLPFTAFYVIPFLSNAMAPNTADAAGGVLADFAAVDVQLGDCALSVNGCRPDLQARRHVYAGNRCAWWDCTSG